MQRAEQPLWRHANRSSDQLPFVGEDDSLERHVNVYARLATLHMQMASTKALVQSMPSGDTIQPRIPKPGAILAFREPNHSVVEVEPTYCDNQIRRFGTLGKCNNILMTDGACPAQSWHEEPSPDK